MLQTDEIPADDKSLVIIPSSDSSISCFESFFLFLRASGIEKTSPFRLVLLFFGNHLPLIVGLCLAPNCTLALLMDSLIYHFQITSCFPFRVIKTSPGRFVWVRFVPADHPEREERKNHLTASLTLDSFICCNFLMQFHLLLFRSAKNKCFCFRSGKNCRLDCKRHLERREKVCRKSLCAKKKMHYA